MEWLALMFVLAFALLPLTEREALEKYRPEELKVGEEEKGVVSLFRSLLAITVLLVALKLLGFRLSWIIDAAVFSTGFIFGDAFGVGVPLGLLLLSLRKSGKLELYNTSSALTIVLFSVVLSRFIPSGAALLFMSLLGLYDVVGVLYLPYIKFLWLQFSKVRFDGVALVCSDGFVGAGDFALPLLFALSFGLPGFLSLPLFALAFRLNSLLSRRFGAFPGLPLQTFFALAFHLALS